MKVASDFTNALWKMNASGLKGDIARQRYADRRTHVLTLCILENCSSQERY